MVTGEGRCSGIRTLARSGFGLLTASCATVGSFGELYDESEFLRSLVIV